MLHVLAQFPAHPVSGPVVVSGLEVCEWLGQEGWQCSACWHDMGVSGRAVPRCHSFGCRVSFARKGVECA